MYTKKFRYRNIDFVVQRHPSLYSHYIVECVYKCKHIKCIITNLKVVEFCDDDEHKKFRAWARKLIMYKVKEQYERSI